MTNCQGDSVPGTIVLGPDGASWRLVDKYTEEGILPNISRIKEEGSWAGSRSCLPPVTSPNWKCYSTGKNPGKLGVFWWECIGTEDGKLEVPLFSPFRRDAFHVNSSTSLNGYVAAAKGTGFDVASVARALNSQGVDAP